MIFKVKVSHYKTEPYWHTLYRWVDNELVNVGKELRTRQVLTHSTYQSFDTVVQAVHHVTQKYRGFYENSPNMIYKGLYHVIFDEYDIPYTPDHLQFLYENSPNMIYKGYVFRGSRRHRYFTRKTPRTMNEKRFNHEFARAKRRELPNSWDFQKAPPQRSWKSHRKTQYHGEEA